MIVVMNGTNSSKFWTIAREHEKLADAIYALRDRGSICFDNAHIYPRKRRCDVCFYKDQEPSNPKLLLGVRPMSRGFPNEHLGDANVHHFLFLHALDPGTGWLLGLRDLDDFFGLVANHVAR